MLRCVRCRASKALYRTFHFETFKRAIVHLKCSNVNYTGQSNYTCYYTRCFIWNVPTRYYTERFIWDVQTRNYTGYTIWNVQTMICYTGRSIWNAQTQVITETQVLHKHKLFKRAVIQNVSFESFRRAIIQDVSFETFIRKLYGTIKRTIIQDGSFEDVPMRYYTGRSI